MKSLIILFIPVLLVITDQSYAMDEDSLLMNLLPDSTFLPVESEKIYQTDYELYDYINGGAELYLHYGFKKLAKRIYSLSEENEIKAEVFDMSEPKNAFGVFSYAKQEENIGIGQGAQYIGGSLIFWQDRYFVSIFAQKETEKSQELVRRIGVMISEAIGDKGELPPVFHCLPQESLVKESTFYFHHHAWQNKFIYISHDNIFNINEKVDALLNQYGGPQNRYYLLLVKYPDPKKARKAYKKSRQTIAGKLKQKRIIQDKHGKWTGCDLAENLLLFVFDAPSEEKAKYLLDQTRENYNRLILHPDQIRK